MTKFAAFLIVALITTMASAEPADVYIFSGQSNMVGSARIAELTEAQRQPIPEARFWNGASFEILTPGSTVISADKTRFGPELAFVRHYAAANPDQPCYIIKYARGGRPLHAGFDGGTWKGPDPGPGRSTFYPGEKPGDPNTGVLYTQLVKTVNAALSHLKAQGVDYRVRGVLWMQGEADAKHPVAAETYAKNLRHWHERLLADIGAEPCPLVFGQVLPYSPPKPRFTDRKALRQSQANLDRDSGHPDSYEWARMVPTDGMELLGDTVHYSAAGQLKLGTAFAEAMQAMQRPNP